MPVGGTVPVDLAAHVLDGGSNYGIANTNYVFNGTLWKPMRADADGYMQVAPTPALEVYNVGTAAGTAAASGTITLVGTATVGDDYNIVRGFFQTNHGGTITFRWAAENTFGTYYENTYAATANEKVSILHPNYGTYLKAFFVNSSGAGATVSSQLFAGNWVA
jgi:hypothetical protein